MANIKRAGKLGWGLALALNVLLPSMVRAQSDTVKLGDLAAISNAAVYIAIEKGFFKEQGINTEITNFDSAAKQVPALVVGELEVSVGSARLADLVTGFTTMRYLTMLPAHSATTA